MRVFSNRLRKPWLLCGFAGLLQVQTANAAEQIPTVVVSDTRYEHGQVSTGASVVVIGREEIEASGARNLADLLRGRGGLQISDTFGDGSGASIAMRGLADTAASNTLLLVDGRRLNNPDIGSPSLLNIPLTEVERVEIVQGSAGTLFGDQAVGGVVNIISRAPHGQQLSVQFGLGSYAGWQGNVSANLPLNEALNLRLFGEHRRSDNYRDNNKLRLQNLGTRLDFDYDSGLVFAELQSSNRELGTPGALFAEELAVDRRQVFSNFANDFSNERTGVWRLGLRQALGDYLSLEGEWMRRDNDVDFLLSFRSGFPVTPGTQDRTVTELTPRLVASLPLAHGDLVLTLGHDRFRSQYRLVSSIGNQRNRQAVDGSWLQVVAPINDWVSLTVGYRHARVENQLIDTFTFPSLTDIDDSVSVYELGLSLRPTQNWRWFARRDGNFRFAKVDEFTDPPPGVVLDTQQGVSWETGLEWNGDTASARAVLYRLDLRDEIAVVPGAGAFNFPANTNIDETRRDGLILSWQQGLATDWLFSGSYNFTDAEIRAGMAAGREVPMVSRHSGQLALDYQSDPDWKLRGELVAVSDRVFSGDLNNSLGKLPGYGVLNLSGQLDIGAFSLGVRINNALDKQYSDYGAKVTLFPPPTFSPVERESFFPAAERNFWLTLRYRMD